VAVADSLVSAIANVLGSNNLLLCSQAQARQFGLHWWPVGEVRLARGFDLVVDSADERLRAYLDGGIARCLGALHEEGNGS
jgi:hypothetical protein